MPYIEVFMYLIFFFCQEVCSRQSKRIQHSTDTHVHFARKQQSAIRIKDTTDEDHKYVCRLLGTNLTPTSQRGFHHVKNCAP